MIHDSFTGTGISQRFCYISATEEVFAALLNNADASKFLAAEGFHLVFHVSFRPFLIRPALEVWL